MSKTDLIEITDTLRPHAFSDHGVLVTPVYTARVWVSEERRKEMVAIDFTDRRHEENDGEGHLQNRTQR